MEQTELDRIRNGADFAAIVREVTEIAPVGQRWMGRCPFHQGEGDTLAVDTDAKRYRCFECEASGDVFRFLQDTRSIDHDTAVRLVAEQYTAA